MRAGHREHSSGSLSPGKDVRGSRFDLFLRFYFMILIMYISVWVCAHGCNAFRGQRGHQIPWTWSEQMTGSHFTLLLGVKLRSCARAARTLNHRAISAGPGFCSESETSPDWPNAQSSCLVVMNSGMIGIRHRTACPLTLRSCLCHELRPFVHFQQFYFCPKTLVPVHLDFVASQSS